jgi:hypothetical protein
VQSAPSLCSSARDDVGTVQLLLDLSRVAGCRSLPDGPLKTDGRRLIQPAKALPGA